VGGKSGKILFFGDGVDNLGCLAESSVDVCGADELDGAIDEASGGEDGKGKIMWKAKVSCKKTGRDGWPDEQKMYSSKC
jgi:hypothetical protein